MPDSEGQRFSGDKYRFTVSGPDAVPHADGTLKVTSIDVFEHGIRVRSLFWVPANSEFDPAREADISQRLAPLAAKTDPEELADAIASGMLFEMLGNCVVDLALGPRNPRGSGGGGMYGERTVMLTESIALEVVPETATLEYGSTRLVARLGPERDRHA